MSLVRFGSKKTWFGLDIIHRVHIKKVPLIFCRNFYKYWRIFIIFRAQLRQRMPKSHWRKIFLPHIRYVATILCESVRHKSNTVHTILAFCTCLYRSHLWKPVSMKWTESQRLKIYVQNVHHLREHMHSTDYAIAQMLPAGWCGPAASTRSAHVLSTPSRHGSANGRPSIEGYPRYCSPLDSNLANWMATSLEE